MLLEGNAAHPVGCDSPLLLIEMVLQKAITMSKKGLKEQRLEIFDYLVK
jgi:hypothetical protein